MDTKLHRVIRTEGEKNYEYIGFLSEISEEANEKDFEINHKFDWCVKKSFEKSPYFGAVSIKNPKYGFYISRWKTVYDRYFSKEMKLEDNLSERIRVQYESKKSGKTTSGNEFSSGKFYSVASSSRLAVTSFTLSEKGILDYVDEITIDGKTEKIIDIEFEHDTPVKGIHPNSHCPQLDVYFKTKAGTYFVEVKNHEILDCYKSIELSPSYMSTEPFKKLGLKQELNVKNKKDKYGNNTDDTFISLKGNLEKNRFLLSSDFGCELDTHHFDFKQFLCHLMGIWSYAEKNPDEDIYFYYLVYRNKLYEDNFDPRIYMELEAEVKIIFGEFKKVFPQIHFGLCYNDRYDTLKELRTIL